MADGGAIRHPSSIQAKRHTLALVHQSLSLNSSDVVLLNLGDISKAALFVKLTKVNQLSGQIQQRQQQSGLII